MGEIKGTTRVCGLIGNPVGHSISPVIHNTLADLCGIDMVYTTFKVEKGAVDTAVKGAYALDILGLNVTVPHKQEVIGTLESVDPLAEAIGAVNTLVRTEHGYKGYNTDILGLERELEEEQVELKEQSCDFTRCRRRGKSYCLFMCQQRCKRSCHFKPHGRKSGSDCRGCKPPFAVKGGICHEAFGLRKADRGKLCGHSDNQCRFISEL